MPLGAVGLMIALALLFPGIDTVQPINVAFVGNSITFVNDLPRFLQALSPTMHQDSCLHGALSFLTMMYTGNGMYNKWSNQRALLTETYQGNHTIYDFGSCSFPQLLFGRDDNLKTEGYYYYDGKNPCFQDPVYLQYLNELYEHNETPPQWDYVVLNDQTKYPADYNKRQKSLAVLKQVYAEIFIEAQVRPVFLVTHGYSNNSSKLGDIPEFTSKVYYGYQQYAEILAGVLPEEQAPLLAPCGLAFLTIWEESYGMWKRLFAADRRHPSPHGTYLIGCVLYATLYQQMPDWQLARHPEKLWRKARSMEFDGQAQELPSPGEAIYLYGIAQRVALEGYRPASLWSNEAVEAWEQAQLDDYS